VPGTFRARVDGGDGNDLVLLDLVNNPFDNFDAVKPNLDLYATGGRGADSVLLLSELFFAPTLGPLGIPLVSGGLDPNDTCIANTGNEQLSCELN
jgi:hypothetical protein